MLIFLAIVVLHSKKKKKKIKVTSCVFAVLLFQDGLIDQLYDLMLEYFHTQSHSICFPELALSTIIQVKQLILTLTAVYGQSAWML